MATPRPTGYNSFEVRIYMITVAAEGVEVVIVFVVVLVTVVLAVRAAAASA